VIRLTKDWWDEDKLDYIFDPKWFDEFKSYPQLTIPQKNSDGTAGIGKVGIVFWHEPDGQTIFPAGVTYCDGKEFIFCYHPDYVNDPHTEPLSVTLPKRTEPYRYSDPEGKALLPFFDNLVSEGWLGLKQRNACHHMEGLKDDILTTDNFEKQDSTVERYKRFLTFGRGFHGAVAVVDAVAPDYVIATEEQEVEESMHARGTLGGAQRKMLGVKADNDVRSTGRREMSTHMVKMGHKTPERMRRFPDMLENEYMSLVATAKLLPEDKTAKAQITLLSGTDDKALIITRFDRNNKGGRHHFEEALQMMGQPSYKKYEGTYRDLAKLATKYLGEDGKKKVFMRIVGQLLMGNTDNHLKNFAFRQENGKWELTPNYDLLPTSLYKRSWLALGIKQGKYVLSRINPRKIDLLGEECGLSSDQTLEAVREIRAHIDDAKKAVMDDPCKYLAPEQKEKFCAMIDELDKQMLAGYEAYYQHTFKRPAPNAKATGEGRA